ncbi:MAG: integrase core domain-containing protein, partial [Planctomycetota bacterium]
MGFVLQLLTVIRALAADRNRLAIENLVLRQQINVLKRGAKRVRLNDSDRAFWVLIRRFFKHWKDHLVIVKPDTVVRWHRNGFRYYWKWKSRSKPGRPPIERKLIHLIRRMSAENVLWGAPRITSELALLGYKVAQTTVSNYMVKHKDREPSQSWRSFLANHLNVSAACDFFVVPAL